MFTLLRAPSLRTQLHWRSLAVERLGMTAHAMKFSVNWLREFVDLPASVEELAELLTLAGIEIEGIDEAGRELRQGRRRANHRFIATSQRGPPERLPGR